MKAFITFLTVILFTGCSSLAEQKQLARQNSWHQIGVLDGSAGHHRKSRPELERLGELSPGAVDQYREGYQAGIGQFCNPEAAYRHGLSGRQYKGQCSGSEQEDLIVENWLQGYEQFEFDSDMFAVHDRD